MNNNKLDFMNNNVPIHPLLSSDDRGSPAWWKQVKKLGNPLIYLEKNSAICTFLWRKNTAELTSVCIDIYTQTPTIYQQWNYFEEIQGTDIYVYCITLPSDWFGSYVIVATPHQPPAVTDPSLRREWWTQQLQHFSQQDPLNPYPAYTGQLARYINRIYCNPELRSFMPNVKQQQLQWQSTLLPIEPLITLLHARDIVRDEAGKTALILCLDGHIWAQFNDFQKTVLDLNRQGEIGNCVLAFIPCSATLRSIHYGCHDQYCQALVEELIPFIHQHYPELTFDNTVLCGQSMGGLCAVYCSMLYPHQFNHVIGQSGSYWWSDFSNSQFQHLEASSFLNLMEELLKDQNRHLALNQTKFHISTGCCETDMKQHSEVLNQLLNVQKLNSNFQQFYGGHDPLHWAADLLTILEKLFLKQPYFNKGP